MQDFCSPSSTVTLRTSAGARACALAPAEVLSVTVEEGEQKSCTVIVPNNQLSLAIGNKGQNAKLAARLTGFKIDIKPENPVD